MKSNKQILNFVVLTYSARIWNQDRPFNWQGQNCVCSTDDQNDHMKSIILTVAESETVSANKELKGNVDSRLLQHMYVWEDNYLHP